MAGSVGRRYTPLLQGKISTTLLLCFVNCAGNWKQPFSLLLSLTPLQEKSWSEERHKQRRPVEGMSLLQGIAGVAV